MADELNALNEQLQYEATVNGGQSSNNGENGVPMKLNGFNNTNRNNNTCNNNGTMKANGKNRVSSNSIPIKSRNGPNTAQMVAAAKKSRKKTIRDFIDVDGLTKIDDRTFRKIVERDEKYKVGFFIEEYFFLVYSWLKCLFLLTERDRYAQGATEPM